MGATASYDKSRKRWRVYLSDPARDAKWTLKVDGNAAKAHAIAEQSATRIDAGEDLRPQRLRTPTEAPRVSAGAAIPGSFRAFADRWLVRRQKNKKASTNEWYSDNLENHLYGFRVPDEAIAETMPAAARRHIVSTPLGDWPLTASVFTRPVCIAVARVLVGRVSARTQRSIRYKTREGIVRTLSTILTAAYDEGLVPGNPAFRLDEYLVDPDELERPMLVWNHEEVDRLLRTAQAWLGDWAHDYLAVAIKCGLRYGEQCELRWDLDFTIPGHIQVQRQFQERRRVRYEIVDGVRRNVKTPEASRITTTKGKRSRLVKMSADVEQLLARRRTAMKAWALKHGQPVPALTFTALRGGRFWRNRFEEHFLAELCRRARVPVTTRLHTTRHTFASVLLMSEAVTLEYVSQQLGHASVKTTEQCYKHFLRDGRRDAERAARIADAWRVEGRK